MRAHFEPAVSGHIKLKEDGKCASSKLRMEMCICGLLGPLVKCNAEARASGDRPLEAAHVYDAH